jgi:hypothetical protein
MVWAVGGFGQHFHGGAGGPSPFGFFNFGGAMALLGGPLAKILEALADPHGLMERLEQLKHALEDHKGPLSPADKRQLAELHKAIAALEKDLREMRRPGEANAFLPLLGAFASLFGHGAWG